MPHDLRVPLVDLAKFDSLRRNDTRAQRFGSDEPISERIRRPIKIVVIEDYEPLLKDCLFHLGHLENAQVCAQRTFKSTPEAMEAILREKPDIVITDLQLSPRNAEGFEILEAVNRLLPGTIVILTSVVYKPENTDELSQQIRQKPFNAAFNKFDYAHLMLFIEQKAHELRAA